MADKTPYVIVIDDKQTNIALWQGVIEGQGWICRPILADSAEDAVSQWKAFIGVNWGQHPLRATLVDVHLAHGNKYQGLDAVESIVALYGALCCGCMFITSGEQLGDARIATFLADHKARRFASPLSERARDDVLAALRQCFQQANKDWSGTPDDDD